MAGAAMLMGLFSAQGASHPSLLLTPQGVAEIRAARGTNAMFDASLDRTIADADAALTQEIVVPVPRDGGGGYTHEKHKDNYYVMYNCGIAYQMTGDGKYAEYASRMMDLYADLYPTLGFHPVELSKTPGRLFWQTLNECVWLVHTSIAYDCIYDYLPADRRRRLEENLFNPLAEFIMEGMDGYTRNNHTFNLMHNHGTWATAAVGMIGLVTGNDEYVRKALYGSDMTGRIGGFMRQMDVLFSPDGYFTEGAYYLRYAIWPFVMFAQAIDNNMPEMKVFDYRDKILVKAVNVLIQLSYDGVFMKFNDALTKRLDAQEIIYAVDIIYKADPSNKQLLDIAERYQKKFLPTDAGYAVARDITRGQAEPFRYESALFRDGGDGTEGGVALIRSQEDSGNSALLLKATSHGLSHGHYDKLTMAYYDNGNDVLVDYGAVRFLNIEAKYKGHYTRENKSFAMSTIAHNTVVINEQSHFGGQIDESSKYHSDIYLFDTSRPGIDVASAIDSNAYPGVKMHRSLLRINTGFLQYPLIVDIFRVNSPEPVQMDYPIYYNGHLISLNFPYEKSLDHMQTLGSSNGYQHLWLEAWGRNTQTPTSCLTWLTGDRFYSISTATGPQTEFKCVRAGANDPDFNLRPQPGYIIREKAKTSHTFLSAIETHGVYDLQVEQTANAVSSVESVALLVDNADYTVAEIVFKGDLPTMRVLFSNNNADPAARHRVKAGKETLQWTGPYEVAYPAVKKKK